MQTPFLIGIGGPTASGKSLLAERLNSQFADHTVGCLAMDCYYHDADAFPRDIMGNYDHPESLDTSLLVENLADLKSGKLARVPVYDFCNHRRTGMSEFAVRPIVIIEGLLLFTFPRVCNFLDASIYVDAPADIRLARRILRDCSERGRTFQSVIQQYLETVIPMHQRFVEPFRTNAEIEISGLEEPDTMLQQAIDYLKRFNRVAALCDQGSPT